MSDFTYSLVRWIGTHAFRLSASAVWLHADRVPRTGAFILAPTHLSNYDVAVLIADTPRHIDFMSVVEFLKVPFVGRLFRGMNCFFLDRGRLDPKTVRIAIDRLNAGRAVVMFPEGRIREWDDSIIHGKPFKPGVTRIAQISSAPVMPCVVLGTRVYKRSSAWLPFRRVRYGINYGELIRVRTDLDHDAAIEEFNARLSAAYVSLYQELRSRLPPTVTG